MKTFLTMKFCCKLLSSKMVCSLFGPVTLMGNITKMYMRIKLKPDDQDVNTKGGPDVFDRAMFKVNSSLFLEQFDLHGSINLFPLGAKRVFKSTQIVSVFDKETGN